MRWRYIVSIAIAIAVVWLAVFHIRSNPLRRSNADIGHWLLAETPIGTSRTQVLAVVSQHGWYDPSRQQHPLGTTTNAFICGELGSYQGLPWHTSVSAFWEFDAGRRLTNVRVEKMFDMP